MRLTCGIAIALGLSFAAWGSASRPQDGAGSAKSSGQAPAPTAPAQSTPAEPANPLSSSAEEKAPENAAKKNTEADSKNTGSPNGTTKRRKRTSTSTSSVPVPDGTPRKIVVREGGASEPTAQIIPGMTPAEAARERQNAEQWLGSTDSQLRQLERRTLDVQGKETMGQIRNYIAGARSALAEGDVRRASTLAEKANLLADDLVKR